jgi:hypothetical protein
MKGDVYSYICIGSEKQASNCNKQYINKILLLREVKKYCIANLFAPFDDDKVASHCRPHCALLPDEYNDMHASYKELRFALGEQEATARDDFQRYELEPVAKYGSLDVLNEPTSLAGVIEYQLLQGTGEGTLYARLLEDARRKVNGFYECYNRVLEEIAERHRHALEQFGAPQKP